MGVGRPGTEVLTADHPVLSGQRVRSSYLETAGGSGATSQWSENASSTQAIMTHPADQQMPRSRGLSRSWRAGFQPGLAIASSLRWVYTQ